MSLLSKSLYLCALLLLAWLAVVPYWPNIKEETLDFYAAWQQIRNSRGPNLSTAQTAEAAAENARKRSIAPPRPPAELPEMAGEKTSDQAPDPFIREARRRAKEDPAAAMQWLQQQSTGTERLRAMLEVVALWAAKDSESALLWLESNAQGLARLETLNRSVELWARRDPEATAGWIEGMANDQSKISAAKSLTTTWAQTNPTAAATWLDQLPKGPVREEAAQALALSWMESDPAQAAAWTYTEYARSGQHAIMYPVIEKYTQLDPDAAESFVRSVQVDGSFAPEFMEKYVAARAKSGPGEERPGGNRKLASDITAG